MSYKSNQTSSTQPFVNATWPRIAVISVGQTSIFGHPHQEVVRRWTDASAEVLTTGKRGMITFTTDGTNLKLETFAKER